MATVRWRCRRALAKHSTQLSAADVARRYSAIVACRSRFCTCSCWHVRNQPQSSEVYTPPDEAARASRYRATFTTAAWSSCVDGLQMHLS